MADHQCECGEWSGEACQWSGPASEMVVVEWMPEHLRASHAAAGNSGCYPANGSVRLAATKTCAELMLEHDGEWAMVVNEEVSDG